MSLPKLGPYDQHWIFEPNARRLKAFDAKGGQLWAGEARNRTTNDADPSYGHDAPCPPGTFYVGQPRPKNTVPFGPWFIGLYDFGDNHAMADHGRLGIGIHGGGSGLPDPFAPRQGWTVTHGCLRIQNVDLAEVVHLIQGSQRQDGHCYLTVLQRDFSKPDAGEDDYAAVDPALIWPDE